MSEHALRFSVIVPTLGRTERLGQMLESLSRCIPAPAEVIVVDGEGSAATQHVVERYAANAGSVNVVYLDSEPGATVQRNRGLDVTTGDVVVFLDDDVAFDLALDVFEQLARPFADESIVGVTGHILEEEGRLFGRSDSFARRLLFGNEAVGRFTDYGYPRYVDGATAATDVEYMYGGFMCVRAHVARDIGFDEALAGYALCEDEDFSCRLSRRGRIQLLPSIVIRHDRFGPRNARLKDRMLVANRTYLFRKNFRRTPTTRLKFAVFIGMLIGHRLVNGELTGARGLIEGIGDVIRGRVPYASTNATGAHPYSTEKDSVVHS